MFQNVKADHLIHLSFCVLPKVLVLLKAKLGIMIRRTRNPRLSKYWALCWVS